MERLTLRGTDVETSRLGFGCGTLTLHDDAAAAVRMCEAALDLGVTHFDVARQYGLGQAEGILGQFLKGRRDRVTVATKFGLAPPAAIAGHTGFVNFARKLAHRSRAVAAVARVVLRKTARPPVYDAGEAARSLEVSLRELGTEYVDVFFAHECPVDQAAREDLVAALEDERRRGRIRAFGVAGDFKLFRGDAALLPAAYRVLQFDDAAGRGHVASLRNAAERAIVTFGATSKARAVVEAARREPGRAAGVDADLADPGVVTSLLLQSALADNPAGVVLFGTTKVDHLRANVRTAEAAPHPPERLAAFADFVRRALPAEPI